MAFVISLIREVCGEPETLRSAISLNRPKDANVRQALIVQNGRKYTFIEVVHWVETEKPGHACFAASVSV